MSVELDPCKAAVDDVEWARETAIAIFQEVAVEMGAEGLYTAAPSDESVDRMMVHLLGQLNHHRNRET